MDLNQGIAILSCLIFCTLPVQSNPLVYPNKFSFQKTTPSTTEAPILYNHEFSNNSISGPDSSSRGSKFPYEIVAGIVGCVVLICLLLFIYRTRERRRIRRDDANSTLDHLCPPDVSPTKGNLDST